MSNYNFSIDLSNSNSIWTQSFKKIRSKSSILELGADTGNFTKICKKYLNCEIDIIEINKESRQIASSYGNLINNDDEFHNLNNLKCLNYLINQEKKYDYILALDVIEHLINYEQVLIKCKDIMNNDSKFIISIPNISHNSIIIDLINNNFNYSDIGILDRTHLFHFTERSFTNLAINLGYKIEEIFYTYSTVSNYNEVNSYIYTALKNRKYGEVYQIGFVLSKLI